MIRFLTDINFRGEILRGLVRREPAIDAVRAQDVGLDGVEDEGVLQWGANSGRVLVTHDRSTIPPCARRLIASGQTIAGVILVPDDMGTGQAIMELWIVWSCSEPEDWLNRIEYLPF
jgi:hypothetical protein